MKQALVLLGSVMAAFQLADAVLGYDTTYRLAFGSIAVMAMMISFTFLWLWKERATPLALGMSFSWAGAAMVIGWWWLVYALGGPQWSVENDILFHFLALYLVGAILHFGVIQGSFGWGGGAFLLPAGVAFAISAMIALLV